MLHKTFLSFKSLHVTIQMKAKEQYFGVAYLTTEGDFNSWRFDIVTKGAFNWPYSGIRMREAMI